MGNDNSKTGITSTFLSKSAGAVSLITGLAGSSFSFFVMNKPVLSVIILVTGVTVFFKLMFTANIISFLRSLLYGATDNSKNSSGPISFIKNAAFRFDNKFFGFFIFVIIIGLILALLIIPAKESIRTAFRIQPSNNFSNSSHSAVASSSSFSHSASLDNSSLSSISSYSSVSSSANEMTSQSSSVSSQSSSTGYPVNVTNDRSAEEYAASFGFNGPYNADNLKRFIETINPIHNEPYTVYLLNNREMGKLIKLAEVLRHYNKVTIKLIGHTHTINDPSSELTLSVLRAKYIKDTMDQLLNNQSYYFDIYGDGALKMIMPEATIDQQWYNRRVEFTLISAE